MICVLVFDEKAQRLTPPSRTAQIEVPLQIGLFVQSSSVAVDLDAPGFAFVDTIRSPVCSKGIGTIMSSVIIRPRKSGESCGIVGRSRFVAHHVLSCRDIPHTLASQAIG